MKIVISIHMKRLDSSTILQSPHEEVRHLSTILQSPHEERHIHTHEEARPLNNSTITT